MPLWDDDFVDVSSSSRTVHRRPKKPPPVATGPKRAEKMALSDDDFVEDNNFAEAPSLALHGQPPVATAVTFHVGDRFGSF
ncbi:hypothetical protein IscW_ISCW015451 [Ixodes scapularis]|uniref:Uncharacterized protein n=1 Tax=Ixodes scapularis TaxID=6945 RepID=B7QMS2_IXOSC|nr:hypothetical protein IscW_ISCW015451 [Ixodes scapularis]|eukprot:XP_002400247.1 hypothetical protein IscW_ISCW015451 [Ixodes scapularis]